jgi:hypothetical protein
MKMSRMSVAVLPLLFSAAAAFAQSPQSSIRESTDPARVAEVERRAQDLRSGQSTSGGQAQMQQPTAGEHGQMHSDRKRGHGGRHGHHRMHGDHPKAAPDAGK